MKKAPRWQKRQITQLSPVPVRSRMRAALVALGAAALSVLIVSSAVVRAALPGAPGKIAFVSSRDGNPEI